MDKIQISDFIDSKQHEFGQLYYNTLKTKIAAFVKTTVENLALDNSIAHDQFVYGDRVILILVSGKEIKLTLKIHYSPSEIIDLIPNSLLSRSTDADVVYESYFSEMANLIAGSLKASLLDMQHTVGISLPIGASCYDELVSSDKLQPGRSYAYSQIIVNNKSHFVVTLNLEDDGTGIKNYTFVEKVEEEDSEFL